MKDVLSTISIIVVLLSAIAFLIGFIMLFIENKRKLGLKIFLAAIIAFVIGFSTCVATFNLGPMH